MVGAVLKLLWTHGVSECQAHAGRTLQASHPAPRGHRQQEVGGSSEVVGTGPWVKVGDSTMGHERF